MALYGPDIERGSWRDGIRFSNVPDFTEMCEVLESEIKERNIPASLYVSEYVSGRFLSKTKAPLLLIDNTESGCKYFTLGIYLNGNTMRFPMFGESAENTRANKYEYYKSQGIGLKAAFYKPDMLKLDREIEWQASVIECFDSLLID